MTTLLILALAAPQSFDFADARPINDSSLAGDEVVTVDLDGDGHADLLVVDHQRRRLRSFRGRGDGSFDAPDLVFQANVASDPPVRIQALKAADVDGDGQDDAVAIVDQQVVWFPNEGGALGGRTVIPGTPAGIGSAALGLLLTAGDLDGDGEVDLVYSGGGAVGFQPTLIRGTGNGAFTAPAMLSAADARTGFVFCDVDGDTDLDVVYASRAGGGFTLLLNGGALPGVTEVQLNAPGADVEAFDVGDVDGDGLPDIVYSTFAVPGQSQAPLEWMQNLGSGSFAAPVLIDVPSAITERALRLLDVDGDGALDIVGVNGANARGSVRLNLGGGAFSPVRSMHPDTRLATQLAHADFNGDGAEDLVLLGGTGPTPAFLRNRNSGGVQPLFAEPTAIVDGRTPVSVDAVRAVDFDLDGDIDVLLLEPVGGNLTLFRSDGRGGYGQELLIEGLAGFGVGLHVGDLDGDLDPDVVVGGLATGDAMVLLNEGGAAGPLATIAAVPGRIWRILPLVDVDADGDLDLALLWQEDATELWRVSVLRGDGAGSFGSATSIIARMDGLGSPSLADIDLDGQLDLVYQRGGDVEVLFGAGPGAFANPPVRLMDGSNAFVGRDVIVGDMDGNGTLDIVASNSTSTGFVVRWIPTNAAGGFGAVQTSAQAAFTSGHVLEFADVDGDGDADLIAEGDDALVVFGRGPGVGVTAGVVIGAGIAPEPQGFSIADLDGDLDLDAVIGARALREVHVFENELFGEVGAAFCDPAVPNSTGLSGATTLAGSDEIQRNAARLRALGLPPQQFTMFVVSRTSGSGMPTLASVGNLCLTGSIGRFNRPGELRSSGPAGQVALDLDLSDLPVPAGVPAAAVGETWFFQAWHRDVVGGTATSNFTNGVEVTWQ